MAQQFRKIDARIWNDAKFRSLSDEAKLILFLLLTHPSMCSLGAMRHTRGGLAEELGWPKEAFDEKFEELISAGIVCFDRSGPLVWLPNFLRYNPPTSPTHLGPWRRILNEKLPECDLLERLRGYIDQYIETLTKSYRKAWRESAPRVPRPPAPSPARPPDTSPDLAPSEHSSESDRKVFGNSLESDFTDTGKLDESGEKVAESDTHETPENDDESDGYDAASGGASGGASGDTSGGQSGGSFLGARRKELGARNRTTEIHRANAGASAPSGFDLFRAAYPARKGSQRWADAERAFRARLKDGHTAEQMIEGAKRYARFVEAEGKEGTEMVQQAATFVGRNKGFTEEWDSDQPHGATVGGGASGAMRRFHERQAATFPGYPEYAGETTDE